MTRLQHLQKYQTLYESVLVAVLFLINSTILATSIVMEEFRNGKEPDFQMWEPFVWEYTSALATLLLFPGLVWWINKYPFNWQRIRLSIVGYFFASIVFSLLHVAGMVYLRKAVYWFAGEYYDFGNLWYEFFYEYRKDAWSFLFLIAAIHSYRFIVTRLQGEANLVANDEESIEGVNCDRLLIKKLGKEFIIKVSDIEWLESSGNYVNLHLKGRIYPMRTTLKGLVDKIADKGFARIHRSYGVNLDHVSSITPLPSGDSEIELTNGKTLTLSRRYKEQFKLRMN